MSIQAEGWMNTIMDESGCPVGRVEPLKGYLKGLGPDAPVAINDKGGKQSVSPCRCDLLPAKALLHEAAILKYGADKYGDNNWRKIPLKDHINHALTHILAFQDGDTQDDHIGHATCRMLMALETYLNGEN